MVGCAVDQPVLSTDSWRSSYTRRSGRVWSHNNPCAESKHGRRSNRVLKHLIHILQHVLRLNFGAALERFRKCEAIEILLKYTECPDLAIFADSLLLQVSQIATQIDLLWIVKPQNTRPANHSLYRKRTWGDIIIIHHLRNINPIFEIFTSYSTRVCFIG